MSVQGTGNRQTTVKFQADSGITCSTLRLTEHRKLSDEPPKPSKATLRTYNGAVIRPLATASLRCQSKTATKKIHFKIIDGAPDSLLSGRAIDVLGLVQFTHEHLVHRLTADASPVQRNVIDSHADVFIGLGTLPGLYHIELNSEVKPVQSTRRHILVREELKEKLDNMEEQRILAKVMEPTKWISNMVVVCRNNKICVCLYPYHLNKAIKHSHYPIPTVDEITARLKGAKVFTVIDAKDGFSRYV